MQHRKKILLKKVLVDVTVKTDGTIKYRIAKGQLDAKTCRKELKKIK
jgi:hypothetical protein